MFKILCQEVKNRLLLNLCVSLLPANDFDLFQGRQKTGSDKPVKCMPDRQACGQRMKEARSEGLQ